MKGPNVKGNYECAIIRWETVAAMFLQIEFSPSHILRIRIDKKATK